MSNICSTCQATISWDRKQRDKLGTNRPLNVDGTIHTHGNKEFKFTPTESNNSKPYVDPELTLLKQIAQSLQALIALKELK
ncbi:MAG TPA: hypothetical protein VI033_03530 [Candidatus Nitrosopolaris sp.]